MGVGKRILRDGDTMKMTTTWQRHLIRLFRLAGVVLAVGSQIVGCGGGDDSPDPTFAATKEGMVQGASDGSVVVFKGIPYAAPPVGGLRWKAPAPAPSRTSTLSANTFGARCTDQEDCLYLNVYRSAANTDKRPVLVWIHGGGLAAGSASFFDGSALASDNGFVVVTINYRLAGLGFLAHPALTAESGTSGNYGMLDQQAALKWVRSNISQFGGDPANVTIMGQSAGGVSVSTHLASPLAAGLFDKGVVLSGAYLRSEPTLAAGEAVGKGDAEKLGCPGTDSTAAQCLRALSFAALRSGATGAAGGTWSPLVDNKLLVEPTAAAFSAGRFNRVPTIMGAAHDEETVFATFLLPPGGLALDTYAPFASALSTASASEILTNYPAAQFFSPARAVFQALTDYRFVCGMVADVSSISMYVPKTWQYEFTEQNPPQSVPDGGASYPGPILPSVGPFGDYHSSDVDYWFKQFQTVDQQTPSNLALSASMRAYLANFSRTGDPNGAGLVAWQAAGSGASIAFATPIVPNTDTAANHHCGFWKTKPPSDRLI